MKDRFSRYFSKGDLDKNTNIILTNTIFSIIIKGSSVIVAFLTTPAYMTYFSDNEMLGTWFTILSVLAWILYCDMGIGNGLRNEIVYAIANRDTKRIQSYISSAYIFLATVGGALIVLFVGLGRYVNWNLVFNVSESSNARSTLTSAVSVLVAAIIVQFVLRLVTSILYAMQKAFIPSLLSLLTNVFLLVSVVFLNATNQNSNILVLAWIYFAAVNIPLVAATVYVFSTMLKHAAPNLSTFNLQLAKSLLKVGGVFLWLQIAALVLDTTNSYLITLFVGNSAVVEYQVYFRVFSITGSMVTLLSTSIWSTVTKAKAENNIIWLKKAYKLFMLIGCALSIANFVLVALLQPLFNVWLGNNTIPVNYAIALVFAFSGSVMVMRTILSTFSNGLCEIKVQAIYLTIGAVINVPLAYVFVQITHSYIAIVIANIISMLPYCIVQPIAFSKSIGGKTNYG